MFHGGGKEVTKVCKQLGKEPKFVTSPSGIKSRYTDKETAEIFYNGNVRENKQNNCSNVTKKMELMQLDYQEWMQRS